MGKKSAAKKSWANDDGSSVDSDEATDPELIAEMQALREIQREKYPQTTSADEEDEDGPRKKQAYNRDGLLSAFSSMETTRLPFVETLMICKFSVDVPDEDDDLQREVNLIISNLAFMFSNPIFFSSQDLLLQPHAAGRAGRQG